MSRFRENFLEIRNLKNVNTKRVEKIFRKFFHVFFKCVKSIAAEYGGYYRIRQGIDTIELVSTLSPSLIIVKEVKFPPGLQLFQLLPSTVILKIVSSKAAQ